MGRRWLFRPLAISPTRCVVLESKELGVYSSSETRFGSSLIRHGQVEPTDSAIEICRSNNFWNLRYIYSQYS